MVCKNGLSLYLKSRGYDLIIITGFRREYNQYFHSLFRETLKSGISILLQDENVDENVILFLQI